jgi:hypothetical protein
VIYTPDEIINRRDERKGQNRGPQAKKPTAIIYRYASNRVKNGRRLGAKCLVLDRRRWPRTTQNPCFLGGSRDTAPIHLRNSRGDINESAELLITAAC